MQQEFRPDPHVQTSVPPVTVRRRLLRRQRGRQHGLHRRWAAENVFSLRLLSVIVGRPNQH